MPKPKRKPPPSIHAFLRQRLLACRGNWNVIVAATGANYWVLSRLASRADYRPTLESVEPLIRFFGYSAAPSHPKLLAQFPTESVAHVPRIETPTP